MNPPGFLFSGQLAEIVGMGRDFWESDPEARELFERTSDRCGRDLEKIVFEEQSGTLPVIEKGVPDMNPMGCQKGANWSRSRAAVP